MTDHVTPNKARELAGTLDLTQYAEHSDALMSLAAQVEELIKSEAELCENTVTLQNDLVDAEAQVEQMRDALQRIARAAEDPLPATLREASDFAAQALAALDAETCEHEYTDELLLSLPPRRKCRKCGRTFLALDAEKP